MISLAVFSGLLFIPVYGLFSLSSSPSDIRAHCELLLLRNEFLSILSVLSEVENLFGSLKLDNELPSLYNYKAVALFETNNIIDAENALNEAVQLNPTDVRSWLNLAEIGAITGNRVDAIDNVERLTGSFILAKYFQQVSWKELELKINHQESMVLQYVFNLSNTAWPRSLINGIDETSLNGSTKRKFKESFFVYDDIDIKLFNQYPSNEYGNRKTVVGIILGKADNSPVIQLIQSLVKNINRQKFILIVYLLSTSHTIASLTPFNLLISFDEVVSLEGLSSQQCAVLIAQRRVDILIDVNGQNILNGLQIMKYQPSKLQISFLGDPLSSASSFLNYYIGDAIAIAPDMVPPIDHFSEKVVMLPTCYLTNSHAAWLQDVLYRPRYSKTALARLTIDQRNIPITSPSPAVVDNEGVVVDTAHSTHVATAPICNAIEDGVLFGAFHGYGKMDPMIFHVWMNILRRVSATRSAGIVFSDLSKSIYNKRSSSSSRKIDKAATSIHNILQNAHYHGINQSNYRNTVNNSGVNNSYVNDCNNNSSISSGLWFLPSSYWFEHIYYKSAIDIYLDTTYSKNGHTTSLDAAWAGIPIIALAGQNNMAQRSSESIVSSHKQQQQLRRDNSNGIVYSLKEYEDLAVALTAYRKDGGKVNNKLSAWRQHSERMRINHRYNYHHEDAYDSSNSSSGSSSDGNVFDHQYYSLAFSQALQAMIDLNELTSNNNSDCICNRRRIDTNNNSDFNNNSNCCYHLFYPK